MKKILPWVMVLLVSIPIVLTVLLSIFSYYRYPQLFPSKLTVEYWQNLLFLNPLMLVSVRNSILIGIINAILSTVIGFMTGRALVKLNINKHMIVTMLYSIPLFIPATALFIGVHLVIIRLSFANTMIGVVLAHMIISIPYSTNIAISFFRGIPTDMEHVARTLGCKDSNLLKKVIIPLIIPGLLFSGAICFLLSFSEYFAAFLIGGGRIITVSTLLYPFINNADYGNSATLSIVFVLINILIFFIADYLTHKLTKANHLLFE